MAHLTQGAGHTAETKHGGDEGYDEVKERLAAAFEEEEKEEKPVTDTPLSHGEGTGGEVEAKQHLSADEERAARRKANAEARKAYLAKKHEEEEQQKLQELRKVAEKEESLEKGLKAENDRLRAERVAIMERRRQQVTEHYEQIALAEEKAQQKQRSKGSQRFPSSTRSGFASSRSVLAEPKAPLTPPPRVMVNGRLSSVKVDFDENESAEVNGAHDVLKKTVDEIDEIVAEEVEAEVQAELKASGDGTNDTGDIHYNTVRDQVFSCCEPCSKSNRHALSSNSKQTWVLYGDFSLGEIRWSKPVVGRPHTEFCESYVSSVRWDTVARYEADEYKRREAEYDQQQVEEAQARSVEEDRRVLELKETELECMQERESAQENVEKTQAEHGALLDQASDLKIEKQMIEIQYQLYRSEGRPAAECADVVQARKDINEKINHMTTKIYVSEREFNAAKTQLRAAHQRFKNAKNARIAGAPKLVAFMKITEADQADMYNLPDEITWKELHSQQRRGLNTRNAHAAAAASLVKVKTLERTHSPIVNAFCIPCYPDGWLISEYDLPTLLKKRAWTADSHGHRQLDVVHDLALVQALRASYFIAGNIEMTGYGWSADETKARLVQALSPRSRGGVRFSSKVGTEEDKDDEEEDDEQEHGAQNSTREDNAMEIVRRGVSKSFDVTLDTAKKLKGTASDVAQAMSEAQHRNILKGDQRKRRVKLDPQEDSTYVFSRKDGHRAGKVRLMLQLSNVVDELRIRVVEGRHLIAADMDGLSDPYAECVLCDDAGTPVPGAVALRTRYIEKTLNPYWNEVLVLGRGKGMHVESMCLRITVKDWDMLSADDDMGFAIVSLWSLSLSRTEQTDIWVPLQYTQTGPIGEFLTTGPFANIVSDWSHSIARSVLRKVEQKLEDVGKVVAWGPAADPAMPWQVKLAFGHVIEGIWSEISLQVMASMKGVMKIESVSNYQAHSAQDATSLDRAVFGCSCYDQCGFNGVRQFIAWFRYKNYPCDKDLWAQLGDPVWYLLRVAAIVNNYFIQTILYVFKIVTMERRDDFQVMQFITEFKGLQLFSGMVSAITGAGMYLECAGLKDENNCKRFGPGAGFQPCGFLFDDPVPESQELVYEQCNTFMPFADFALKIAMVHIAGWVFLRYSTSMGGKLFMDNRLKNCIIEIVREIDDDEYKDINQTRQSLNLSVDRDPSPVEHSGPAILEGGENSRFHTKWKTFQKVAANNRHRQYVNAKVVKFDPKTGLHTVQYHREYEPEPPKSWLGFGLLTRRTQCKHRRHRPCRLCKYDTSKQAQLNLGRTRFRVLKLPGISRSPIHLLLCYDLFVLFGLLTYFYTIFEIHVGESHGMWDGETADNYWKLRTLIYWFKTLYMICSFPFLVLQIPGLKNVLTHATRTGYNRRGVCVKHLVKKDKFEEKHRIQNTEWRWCFHNYWQSGLLKGWVVDNGVPLELPAEKKLLTLTPHSRKRPFKVNERVYFLVGGVRWAAGTIERQGEPIEGLKINGEEQYTEFRWDSYTGGLYTVRYNKKRLKHQATEHDHARGHHEGGDLAYGVPATCICLPEKWKQEFAHELDD